jgi:hypothetical protein
MRRQAKTRHRYHDSTGRVIAHAEILKVFRLDEAWRTSIAPPPSLTSPGAWRI